MIINAFKDKIFPLSPEGFPEYEDEDEDNFFTTKEVTPSDEISDLGIKEIFEDEQPDTTDMPDLETEESAEERKKQEAKGLKILTPQQILIRLPISLAQLRAENNSQKLKNKIR